MKVILAVVASLDGKITNPRGKSPQHWASKEDQQFFFSLIKKHKVIIMGKNTYLAAKKNIRATPGKLKLVFTRNPNNFLKYQKKDKLEFVNQSPKKVLSKLQTQGLSEALLVSGAKLNSLFLKEKLISEIWLTLEPKIFGLGKTLVDQTSFNINLKLLGIKRLNSQGTLLLKYSVIY